MKLRIKKRTLKYAGLVIGVLAICYIAYAVLDLKEIKGDNMEIVVIETSKGNIEVQIDQKSAPITAENFLVYVKENHYDSTIFHRVIPGFMIQGGGFAPDGKEKQTHDPIKLESQNGLKNLRGTIAMARTMVADSATDQFFINLADNAFLDYAPGNPGYAVFGKVVKGMEVVDEIAKAKTGSKGPNENWPVEDIMITKVHIKE
ncbi:MAG: peptidyl-prolyl cis-trans isomerase [Nanoarchaeota archaeon]|nr:peptidyl-prolyl cis-trans isomerase [Nanoarchaeota archaeon]